MKNPSRVVNTGIDSGGASPECKANAPSFSYLSNYRNL